MMIDASAIVAILNAEHEGPALAATLGAAKAPFTSPIAVFEAVTALMRENTLSSDEANSVVRQFLEAASVKVVLLSDTMTTTALRAFESYGKGMGHPARLNMGDCFAYACARAYRAPLLFKGDDFTQTDIEAA
ncbi:ribonuclease VapC [Rhizobiales bacterium GAS191]|nr:ribonuclease VapC [Rhizobiales bacterium GAS191]